MTKLTNNAVKILLLGLLLPSFHLTAIQLFGADLAVDVEKLVTASGGAEAYTTFLNAHRRHPQPVYWTNWLNVERAELPLKSWIAENPSWELSFDCPWGIDITGNSRVQFWLPKKETRIEGKTKIFLYLAKSANYPEMKAGMYFLLLEQLAFWTFGKVQAKELGGKAGVPIYWVVKDFTKAVMYLEKPRLFVNTQMQPRTWEINKELSGLQALEVIGTEAYFEEGVPDGVKALFGNMLVGKIGKFDPNAGEKAKEEEKKAGVCDDKVKIVDDRLAKLLKLLDGAA